MHASAEKIWDFAQQHLRSMLSADTYKLWFESLRATTLEGNSIVLEVANDFCEVWLKDNYMGLLQDVLSRASAQPMHVKFKVVTGNTLANPATVSAKAARTSEAPAEKHPGDFGF